jgi:neurotransmitter:Na+ symporter, NSS family
METNAREHWGSRFGFIMAAAGSAIGLGNIWKFPYLVGANGGAAFVILYLICIMVLGLPILVTEIVIGRHTKKDPVGAMKIIGDGSPFKNTGYLGVFAGISLLSYYSVVGGWTVGYIVKSAMGTVADITAIADAERIFTAFTGNPVQSILYHFIFMAATMFIVIRGIHRGIERWNKILMPMLFVILLVLIVRSNTMEGSARGLVFYLYPDFSKITVRTVIEAMGQCFFSLSLGLGAMITYGSYLPKGSRILDSSLKIALLDTAAAFLAGLVIFPAVYAVGMTPDKGPGLTFHILPVVFSRMHFGSFFAFLFFVLLFIAAITSSVSLLEVTVAYITDEKKWGRKKAVIFFGTIIFLLGIPSALSFSVIRNVPVLFGSNFFDFMDRLVSHYMLPVGGLLISICLGWRYGTARAMKEFDDDTFPVVIKRLWAFAIRYVTPVILIVILIYFGFYTAFR